MQTLTDKLDSEALDFSEASLLAAMTNITPAGVRLGCSIIRSDGDQRLLPEERFAVTTRNPQARRASGAARHLARGLLEDIGYPGAIIGREKTGRPIWPAGIIGSLAHDDVVAVAAVSTNRAISAIGIDVEPATPLPDDLSSLVLKPNDDPGTIDQHLAGRVIFASKEAVFKATCSLDGVLLEHDDITVNLATSCAWTRTGHVIGLRWCLSPRIVVLAIPSKS